MINVLLLYLGAGLPILWGVSHLFPTRSVVSGFGDISVDNKHVIMMEWIGEGVSLIFIGVLVATVSFLDAASSDAAAPISRAVYLLSSTGLMSLAIVSLFTGFRINFLPYKMCPLVFTASALLILLGGFLQA